MIETWRSTDKKQTQKPDSHNLKKWMLELEVHNNESFRIVVAVAGEDINLLGFCGQFKHDNQN